MRGILWSHLCVSGLLFFPRVYITRHVLSSSCKCLAMEFLAQLCGGELNKVPVIVTWLPRETRWKRYSHYHVSWNTEYSLPVIQRTSMDWMRQGERRVDRTFEVGLLTHVNTRHPSLCWWNVGVLWHMYACSSLIYYTRVRVVNANQVSSRSWHFYKF